MWAATSALLLAKFSFEELDYSLDGWDAQPGATRSAAHTTKSDATRGPGFPGKVPLAMRPKLMLPAQLKLVLSARFK